MNNNFRITRLKLNNYRNHKFLQIIPEKDIILISGKNGSGKTNILESISLFDSNAGFRNATLSELINSDLIGPPELFGVNISGCLSDEPIEMGLGMKKKTDILKKIVSLNSQKKNNLKKIMNVFWVLPQMSHLFQSSPEDRRNFLDLMISTTDDFYKKKILEYKKYKYERLKILKNNQNIKNQKWLDIVEKKMSEVGVMICDSRRVFLNSLNRSFKKIDDHIPLLYLKLNGEMDKVLEKKPALYVEALILDTLKNNREKDSITGRTNFSVDRTDLLVFDKHSKQEAKNFSTGEQKIIIISIIFSFLNILEKVKASRVLFLLDDIFSYLDNRFIKNIIMRLDDLKLQTWITDVRANSLNDIQKGNSIIHNINIDDYRFKVVNN